MYVVCRAISNGFLLSSCGSLFVCVCVQGGNVLNFLRFAVAETAAVANYVRYVCSQEELDYARELDTL